MQQKKIKVAVSGYFNPLHIGHLEMVEKAKTLGDYLVVIINNDNQVRLKGRVPFMSEQDRLKIVGALRCVDEVFLSIDQDLSVCQSLEKVKPDIFGQGGDRNEGNIPEADICRKLKIKMIDGLGQKIRSSSDLIKDASEVQKNI